MIFYLIGLSLGETSTLTSSPLSIHAFEVMRPGEKQLIEAAEMGDRDAARALALAYYHGEGRQDLPYHELAKEVPQDFQKAFYWFSRIQNEKYLGFMRKVGQGCIKDLAKAFDHFKKAHSWFNLFAMYYRGKDVQAAYEAFQKGVEDDPLWGLVLSAINEAKQGGSGLLTLLLAPEEKAMKTSQAFEVFKSLLDQGEKTENKLLQLMMDFNPRFLRNGLPMQELISFIQSFSRRISALIESK